MSQWHSDSKPECNTTDKSAKYNAIKHMSGKGSFIQKNSDERQ